MAARAAPSETEKKTSAAEPAAPFLKRQYPVTLLVQEWETEDGAEVRLVSGPDDRGIPMPSCSKHPAAIMCSHIGDVESYRQKLKERHR